jgi:hypothetical protein
MEIFSLPKQGLIQNVYTSRLDNAFYHNFIHWLYPLEVPIKFCIEYSQTAGEYFLFI